MTFEEYIIQERGEVFYKDSLNDKNKVNADMPIEEWFSNMYAEYLVKYKSLKITVHKLDPAGIPIETHVVDTSITFPWQLRPVETKFGTMHMYEQRRKWRHLIQIGDYEYYVHRDGRLEQLGGFKGDKNE